MARLLTEIVKDMNRFYTEHYDAFQGRIEAVEFLGMNVEPDDPMYGVIKQDIEEKFRYITKPYFALNVELMQAYREKKGVVTQPRDEMRSRVDADHPRSPFGERSIKDDWEKRKDTFYGPGGKLSDEDKKIILIPGVSETNRASSRH